MATEQIDKAVNQEVNSQVEAVATVAAAQVDAAQRDAEAIARAAVASEQGQMIANLQRENAEWRAKQEQAQAALFETLNREKAEREQFQALIQEKLTQPPTPPTPTLPVVNPDDAVGQKAVETKPVETPARQEPPQRKRYAI
jgi:molecular chaperone GrpE (heat shock protein)